MEFLFLFLFFYQKDDAKVQEFQQGSQRWLRDQKQKNPAISCFSDLTLPTDYLESDIYSKAILLCLFMNVECPAFLEELSCCQNSRGQEVW